MSIHPISSVLFKIPQNSKGSMTEASFVITYHLEFSLLRNQCLLESTTSSSVSCVVHASNMADVTCRSLGLVICPVTGSKVKQESEEKDSIAAEFFACCTFKNTSPVPLRLLGYEIESPGDVDGEDRGDARFEVMEVGEGAERQKLPDSSAPSPSSSSSSSSLPFRSLHADGACVAVLQPGHEYSLALRLGSVQSPATAETGRTATQLFSRAKLPRVVFTYRRWEDHHEEGGEVCELLYMSLSSSPFEVYER